jgi:2-(1,2-epoxy-1,2-dihydrophenyl)acetyl-CoA isomerase
MERGFSGLLLNKIGGVATITLNRPERLNALGADTTFEIYRALEDAVQDPEIRVVVLTGTGRAFCAGGDYKDNFSASAGMTMIQWRQRIRAGVNRLVKLIVECEKPIIASVNGLAVGGGATIALACDIRIASEKAKFQFPFNGIGLTPEFGCSYMLPRLVGPGKALELLYTAEFIVADEALRIGLVNRVVRHEDLEDSTREFVGKILKKPGSAIGMTKSLIHGSLSNSLATQLELEAYAISASFKTGEHMDAVKEFLSAKKRT